MSFKLDEDILTKTDAKGNERTLSERTQKEYTGKLNKIAKAGLATDRASLKKNAKNVIEYIKNLYPEDGERPRHNQRFILYAIFWAMDQEYLKKSNPYHKYLSKIPPLRNSVTGEKWIPLKKYNQMQEKD